MGKIKGGEKLMKKKKAKHQLRIRKEELGKKKQKGQQLDLKEEIKELLNVSEGKKTRGSVKLPETELQMQNTTSKVKRSGKTTDTRASSHMEVSSYMKAFMNTKLRSPKFENQRKTKVEPDAQKEHDLKAISMKTKLLSPQLKTQKKIKVDKDTSKVEDMKSSSFEKNKLQSPKSRKLRNRGEVDTKKVDDINLSTLEKINCPSLKAQKGRRNVSLRECDANKVEEIKSTEKKKKKICTKSRESKSPKRQKTSDEGITSNSTSKIKLFCLEEDEDMFYIFKNVENTIEDAQVYQFSSFTAISVPDTDVILLLMENDGQCALKGKYHLSSMHGVAEIFGYKVTPKSGWCPVYSADNISHLAIRARLDARDNRLEEVRTYFNENRLETMLEMLTDNVCIFAIKELFDPMCKSIASVQPYKKLFVQNSGRYETNLEAIGVVEVDLQDRVFRIADQFIQLSKHFRHAIKESRGQNARAPSLVLAGGSNVGKSTLCRYLVNSVLNSTNNVMFLECDVGQTEVTPPGCVSLSMIRQPFLGPPFTHLQANQCSAPLSRAGPIMQYFVGHVSPADDPAHYVDCLQKTINCYHENYCDVPLIVNTMGWNQGLGLLLMLDTLKMVRPSFLAQIQSTNEHRNYPPLGPQYVRQNQGWRQDIQGPADLDYKRFVINSVVMSSDTHRSYAPAENRDLALLAYLFGRPQNPRHSMVDFFGSVPYMVPWHAVGVRVIHTAVPYRHILYALNASVAGLCVVPQNALQEPEDPTHPKRIPHLPNVPCHMFGLVRGIDPVKKVFYIITPEPLENLVGVNALIVGAVKTPKQLLLRETGPDSGPVPYVDCPQMMQSLPRRRCHQRPRLQKKTATEPSVGL